MEFQQCVIAGSRGAILHCLHTAIDRRRSSLLIALPFGVPVTVAQAAFATFAPDFNVATWESRFILNLDQDFSGGEELRPEAHVEDMLCLLRALGIDACRLIGYCSGAGISLLAASRHPEAFTELVLVNGEYQLFRKGHVSTVYQRSIDTFLPVVANSRRQASLVFAKMAEISKAKGGGLPFELDSQINLPFSKEEYLFRYAKNYMGYRDFDALTVAGSVRQSAFVLTGRRDEHSDMENSEAVAGVLGTTRTFVADRGDHYEFCRAGSSTLAEIHEYLVSKHREESP